MQYFTAVFGETHRRAALGLLRSVRRNMPQMRLTLFTDLPDAFANSEAKELSDLLSMYPEFYSRGQGAVKNVFKFTLFREMQQRYPTETVVWLDADMLVFDDLDRHLVEGKVNVIAHGRRAAQSMNCGDGLRIAGDRYAIGGLYALPPGPALAYLEETTRRRPDWVDDGSPNQMSGDQLILNHLVARGPSDVYWVTDDRRYVFNLEVGEGIHPTIGDQGLRRLKWYREKPVAADGRQVAVLCWIKKQLDLHIESRFSTFHPLAAWRFNRLYADHPRSR